MSKQSVDVLILLQWNCGEDPRLNKIIESYLRQSDVTLGIACVSDAPCSRLSSHRVSHAPFHLNSSKAKGMRNGKLQSLVFRWPRLRAQISKTFSFQMLHACNLDSFALGLWLAGTPQRIIFEIYDSWSSLTDSRVISWLERASASYAASLISPSHQLLGSFANKKSIVYSNAPTKSIIESALLRQDWRKPPWRPYVLAGGSMAASEIRVLARVFNPEWPMDLVIADENPEPQSQKRNVHWIGRVPWEEWLNLMSRAGLIWVWYDQTRAHYQGGMSPNKYWEACLFGIPMLVNDSSAFTDRVTNEPKLYQIGDFRSSVAELGKVIHSFEAAPNDTTDALEELQNLDSIRQASFAAWIRTVNLGIDSHGGKDVD